MSQISKKVRDLVKTRLSNVTTGFNVNHAAVAATYGVTAIVIDWTATSQNFLFGRVAPDLMEESSPFTYPLLTVSTGESENTNLVKFGLFAGPVPAIVEVHLSWRESATIPDFASAADAVEDAMFKTMNDPAAQSTWNGTPLIYNGRMAFSPGTIIMAGENWRQTLSFACQFKVITN